MGTNNTAVVTATTNHNILVRISQQGTTKNALAHKAGIPKTTFNRKIDGHAGFTLAELGQIAEALGLELIDILPVNLLTAKAAA